MKIAEALIKRGTLKSDTESIKERMQKNIKIQEGDAIQEDVNTLLKTYMQKCDELYELTVRINKTNQQIKNAEGETLSELIVRCNTYKDIVKAYKALYDESIIECGNRFTRNEIKFICTVSAEKLQSEIQTLFENVKKIL